MKDIKDSKWIMDRRIGYFVIVKVHDFELLKHVVESSREGYFFVPMQMV